MTKKETIYFIGLKIVEVVGAIAGLILLKYVGYYGVLWVGNVPPDGVPVMVQIFLGVCIVALASFICLSLYAITTKAIPIWIKHNIRLAKRLANKEKK